MNLAFLATGAILLILMLLTMVLVKETPLKEKPDIPLAPSMLRVLGMLAGIALGAVIGLVAGLIVGGLCALVAWPIAGQQAAITLGIAVGGVVAMAAACVAAVWAGTLATIGKPVLRKPSFSWWVVNRLMFLAAVTSLQGFAPYFFMYTFGITREAAASMTGTLLTVVGVFTLLSALPSGWLSDRIGQKRLVALSGWLAVVGTAIILFNIWVPNLLLIYLAGCILGLGTGLFVTTNWALGTRLVPAARGRQVPGRLQPGGRRGGHDRHRHRWTGGRPAQPQSPWAGLFCDLCRVRLSVLVEHPQPARHPARRRYGG